MVSFRKVTNLCLCAITFTLVACTHYNYKEESALTVTTPIPTPTTTEPEPTMEDSFESMSVEDAECEYIFPNSSYDRLSYKEDLQDKTDEELRIGRNEIYARHGRRFNDASLQSYFDTKAWYQGTIEPDTFDYGNLSRIEQINIDAILQVEWQRKIAGDTKTYTYRYDRTEYSNGETFVHPEYKEYFLDILSTDLDHITVRGQEIQNSIQEFTRSDLDYDTKVDDYGCKLNSWINISEHEASYCIDGNDCIMFYTR